jgi:hypothetical protein
LQGLVGSLGMHHPRFCTDSQSGDVREETRDFGVGVGENTSSVPRRGFDWPTNRWHWSRFPHLL